MMTYSYLKKSIFIVWLAAVFCLGLSACDRQWTGDVRGSITDVETEEPIAGVLVKARSMKTSYEITTLSRDDGSYRITDCRWGPNEITVYHPNYESLVRYADVIKDKTVTLDFELELIPDSVYPTITVWATDAADQPIADARVDLYRVEDVSYRDYVYLETKLTDGEGFTQFEIAKLDDGESEDYLIRLAAVGFQNNQEEFTVSFEDPDVTVHVIMEPA